MWRNNLDATYDGRNGMSDLSIIKFLPLLKEDEEGFYDVFHFEEHTNEISFSKSKTSHYTRDDKNLP